MIKLVRLHVESLIDPNMIEAADIMIVIFDIDAWEDYMAISWTMKRVKRWGVVPCPKTSTPVSLSPTRQRGSSNHTGHIVIDALALLRLIQYVEGGLSNVAIPENELIVEWGIALRSP